jgi:hypothetical protein
MRLTGPGSGTGRRQGDEALGHEDSAMLRTEALKASGGPDTIGLRRNQHRARPANEVLAEPVRGGLSANDRD